MRYLEWHIANGVPVGRSGPAYRLDRDYSPVRAWIHLDAAIRAGNTLAVDIKVDGVSAFVAAGSRDYVTTKPTVPIIAFYAQSSADSSTLDKFTDGETVTGGTSSATAIVAKTDVAQGVLELTRTTFTNFTVDETITGGTSGTTALVKYFRPGELNTSQVRIANQELFALQEGDKDLILRRDGFSDVLYELDSIVTLDVLDGGVATDLTVGLELE